MESKDPDDNVGHEFEQQIRELYEVPEQSNNEDEDDDDEDEEDDKG